MLDYFVGKLFSIIIRLDLRSLEIKEYLKIGSLKYIL